MAKDCMGGIRDPDWLDLPPINSLGMGVHSLANLPSNSTIKKKAAIIIMAVEVNSTSPVLSHNLQCSDLCLAWHFYFIVWRQKALLSMSPSKLLIIIGPISSSLCLSETDTDAAHPAMWLWSMPTVPCKPWASFPVGSGQPSPWSTFRSSLWWKPQHPSCCCVSLLPC